MSDTNDMTRAIVYNAVSDGCAPPVDDDNDMTPSLHKVSVQEVASSWDAIESTSVNKINGVAVWYSVGAYFDQLPAAPHRITGMLEVTEKDSTENLAEPSLAGDEAENGSNVSDGSTVWNSVGASFARQPAAPAAPEDHRSSGTAGSTKMRMLELSESVCTKNLKEHSLEENEAENGYQKEAQENNVTKASNANGARNLNIL